MSVTSVGSASGSFRQLTLDLNMSEFDSKTPPERSFNPGSAYTKRRKVQTGQLPASRVSKITPRSIKNEVDRRSISLRFDQG